MKQGQIEIVSDEKLSRELGIGRTTLWRWRKMAGFPKKETAAAIKKWRQAQKRRASVKPQAAAPEPPEPRAPEHRRFIVTTTELVGLLGVSKTAVNNWVNSNGMPIEGRAQSGDTFDLARVLPWLIGYYKQRIEKAREDKRESSQAVRKTKADADLKELELAKRRGELVDVQDAVAKLAGVASNFTGAFRGKAADWSQAVEGKTPDAIARYLDAELVRIFGDLQNTALPENIPPAAAQHFRAAIATIAGPMTAVQESKSQTVQTQEGQSNGHST